MIPSRIPQSRVELQNPTPQCKPIDTPATLIVPSHLETTMPSPLLTSAAIIREFLPGDAPAFRALNEEWITRYFALEPKDLQSFADPQASILAKGGRIFFALSGDTVVGCCALVFMAPGEYEVAKMAVTQSAQRTGLGRTLLAHTVAAAASSGATRLYLETNHILTPAIRLYESLGFQHISPARIIPSPYARADVYMELLL